MLLFGLKKGTPTINTDDYDMSNYKMACLSNERIRILRGFRDFYERQNGSFDEETVKSKVCELINLKWECGE